MVSSGQLSGRKNSDNQITLEDQFRPFARTRRPGSGHPSSSSGGLVITVESIKQCLMLDPQGRDHAVGNWVDDLCKYSLGADNVNHSNYIHTHKDKRFKYC